ncbi:MAG: hypothetical protein ACMZI0_00605, partial [Symbiopectobacterium sp.]|uniref:hypothetical protein n=1 Tax=Symbiopectobacterium sp. TaxID=2952789 RepID=UPI0039E843A3
PMPNSEVKRRSADGSVGLPHVRVGNCQVLIKRRGCPKGQPLFAVRGFSLSPVICAETANIKTRFTSHFINVITFLLLPVCDNIENNSLSLRIFARCFHCVLPNYNNLLVPYAWA